MTIAVGDKLPEATFKVRTPEGLKDVTTQELTAGKKVVLFAVPGAFTPTCHAKHVPSYLENLDALRAKGVDAVACVAVNDAFVLDAWGKAVGSDGKLMLLSDGNATFTKAVGLDFDGSGFGLGTRSKRYSMLVENGVVMALNIEESPGVMEVSGADRILAALRSAFDERGGATLSEALIRKYYDAFNRGDREAMLSLLTDDVAHDINQGGREVGKEAFRRFLAHMDRCYREELTDIVVTTSPDGTMPRPNSSCTAPISPPTPACRQRAARLTSCRPAPSSRCAMAGSRG